MRPIKTSDTVQEFYGYSGCRYNVNNAIVPPVSDTIQTFFHVNENNCALSLVVTMDDGNFLGGGGAVQMSVTGDLTGAEVQDDNPSQFCGAISLDSYVYNTTSDTTLLDWQWPSLTTDGIAKTFESPPTIGEEITFELVSSTGINDWKVVSTSASGSIENFDLAFGEVNSLVLRRVPCAAIVVPDEPIGE
jgi:hypothetical protein